MARKFGSQKIKVEPQFLEKFLKITASSDVTSIAENFKQQATLEQTELKRILAEVAPQEMLWQGPFLQASGVVNFAYNDNLEFSSNSQIFLSWRSPGFFLNTSAEQAVIALHKGKVISTGELPLRGKTIIIDHGLGLISIYSHLQEILVTQDQVVDQGLEIALPGQTGLARKIGWGLEILSSGNQVNPLSWWDQNWYQGHIENKILEIKKLYNIPLLGQ